MAYSVSAFATASFRSSDTYVDVTVSDAATGLPVEDLDATNFDIRFTGQTADILHFKIEGPGLYSMTVTWPFSQGGWGQTGFYRLFVSIKKEGSEVPNNSPGPLTSSRPRAEALSRELRKKDIFLGQTVCPLWVDEPI